MDVLLINPASRLINTNWAYRRFFRPIPPLGLCYIAGVLNNNGIETAVVDQYAELTEDTEIADLIRKEKPLLVGFSSLTPIMPDIRRIVKYIQGLRIDTKIALGNIHATCFPEEIIREGVADIVIRGEGEITMLELCRAIKENKGLENIPGISFAKNGEVIHNPDRGLIEDLDSLSFPAWDLLSLDKYTEVPVVGIRNTRAFPIVASRGCDYRCYYCSQDKVYNKVRYRKLERVIDEMEFFYEKLKIKIFGFSDAYFPFDEESGLKFCDLVIKRGLHKKVKWCTETRVDKVTTRLLRAMKQSGAYLVMYGVEVGNQKVLNGIKKGTTLEQARFAVRETRKAGISTLGLFMLGLPGENEKTCRDTVRLAKELDCDFVKFNIAVPYPGSKFFNDCIKDKDFKDPEKFTSWYDWLSSEGEFIYCPKDLSSGALRKLQRRAMFEYYVRPKIIFRHIIKGSISLENLVYGFFWLASLHLKGILKKLGALIKR